MIAAEDSGFTEHSGVEWDALEKAWEKNERADAAAAQAAARAQRRDARPAQGGRATGRAVPPRSSAARRSPSSWPRTCSWAASATSLRKAQELVLSWELEAILGKRRILEIYLNSVEWGEGVFGAEAAARRYFGVGAGALGVTQAAQLAVMLPAPKRFEKRPGSAYVVGRAATVAARMARSTCPSERDRASCARQPSPLPRMSRWQARTAPRSPSPRRG